MFKNNENFVLTVWFYSFGKVVLKQSFGRCGRTIRQS